MDTLSGEVIVLKRVYFKRKEFAPKASKFSLFRVEPFAEETWWKSLLSCFPDKKSLQNFQVCPFLKTFI